jgi:uncharacterized membrane protein HdeD (DUF308 family)
MAKEKEMMDERFKKMHKHKGCMLLILGILVLLNVYLDVVDWATFIGIILVVAGVVKLVSKKCC